MADLLQSLLIAQPVHPQHLTKARMHSSSGRVSPQQAPGEFPDATPDTPDVSHAFVDADEFLQSIPTSSEDKRPSAIPGLQPRQIGQSRTSEHSVAFHELAQEKRITAVFEYDEVTPQQFSVKATLDGQAVVEDAGPFPSKKAAKEAVCERGLQVLSGMEGMVNPPPSNSENWVGMLQRFYDLEDPTCPRPVYTDFALGSHFACELVIDKRDYAPFGGRLVSFPNKKAAKANAAREAAEWLIVKGYMGPEGPSVKKKRKRGGGSSTAVATIESGATIKSGTTVKIKREAGFAQKVNAVCPLINITLPEYRLVVDPRVDSMYSGAAYFNDPILPSGPIGEVRNLFGKKSAKEAIAKSVLVFLKEWAKEQGNRIEETD